jgi:hypothetical protein
VAWTAIPAWTSGAGYASRDISPVISEIVGLSGWVSGGNLVILVDDNASSNGAERQFIDPRLTITYQVLDPTPTYVTSTTHSTLGSGTNAPTLVLNNETLWGNPKKSLAETTVQGDYYYDQATDLLYLRSASNPGMFYSHIEAAGEHTCLELYAQSYITIQNLALKATVDCGVGMDSGSNRVVEYCDFCSTDGGVFLWRAASNIVCRYNTFNQCSCALAIEGGQGTDAIGPVWFYGNVVMRAEEGLLGNSHRKWHPHSQ